MAYATWYSNFGFLYKLLFIFFPSRIWQFAENFITYKDLKFQLILETQKSNFRYTIRHYSFWALQWRKIVHSTKKIQSFIALFSPCAICVKAFIAYRTPNSETSVILLDCHKTKFNKKKSNLIIRSKACRVQNFFHHSCNNHIYLFLQIFWKHCDSCQNSYIFRHPTESQENCVVHTL